jgi:DNA polymerase III delta subunit
MLQIYYGTDTNAVREAAFLAAAETSNEPPQVIQSDVYQEGQLADALGGASLFGGVSTYIIDTPTGVLAEELAPVLAAMVESGDTFIIIEEKLLALAKKRYQKYTTQMHEYVGEKEERFNTFALADALVKKQKKQLWLLYQTARSEQISPEEVIGILWWQLKALRLAAKTNTAAEAGMKDFPYNKAKGALATLPLERVEELSHELLELYHQGHGGEVELDTALEQWILSL